MKTAVILSILFYLLFINLLSLLFFYINSGRKRAHKKPIPKALQVLAMFLGGGIGTVIGMHLYPRQYDRSLMTMAFGAVVFCGAVFVTVIALSTSPSKASPIDTSDAETERPATSYSMADLTTIPEETTTEKATTQEATATEATTPEETTAEETTAEETTTTAPPTTEETAPPTTAAPQPLYVSIAAIGDMLMHPGCNYFALQPDGSWNYDSIYDAIRDDIASADISIVNNEAPFGGDEIGNHDYPNFNVMSALGDTQVRRGFDVILNANNHIRDQGTQGVLNTFAFWKNKYPNMCVVGIHDSPEDQAYIRVIERSGIRFAILNYTYGLNAGYPAETPYLIDMLREEDKPKIQQELQWAEANADFTIVCPHWGEEYQLHWVPEQEMWAQFFTENGADLILGSHPHCPESIKWITAGNGNQCLCYYSLGNYISCQPQTFSTLGMLAKVVVMKDQNGTRIVSNDAQYFVSQFPASLEWSYVVRLEDYTEELRLQHGIYTRNSSGNGYNQFYPFAIDTFYRIIDEINSY